MARARRRSRDESRGVRVLVLTVAEHQLLVHVLQCALRDGYVAEPTRKVLEVLEAAREVPPRVRPNTGWLSRWRW